MTGGSLDAAIQGSGFFVVKGPGGQTLYTRTGSFILSKVGKLTTLTGESVQGWTDSGLTDIVISTDPLPATPTSRVSLSINLNVSNPKSFSAPFQVFDSAGQVVDASITFVPVTNSQGVVQPNQWTYMINGGTATAPVATGSLAFSADGTLLSPRDGIAFSLPTSSGATQSVRWNLADVDSMGNPVELLTQMALPTELSAVTQDGSPASAFVRARIDDGGYVVAVYDDGREAQVAQLALGRLINPDSLVATGNNNLMTTSASGAVEFGTSAESGLGLVLGGTLESSTVDMASELTDLMLYQRGYQANSRVITTADELLQEALALKS
jgi:flagellar hook protein FlgE